jgi:hypothetical protein
MTQPHPPYSAKRKAWIGAGIALVAVAIVVRYGFDSVPKPEDVAGTVVPAQRYRAPQAAPEIQLGDQSLAQLMQNDAFVRLIRDPQVQALVKEPGFVEAARLLQSHPEAARLMLVHAESGKQVLASPELAKSMAANAEAAQAAERVAQAAAALQASPEAQKVLAQNQELARYVAFFAPERKAGKGQQDYLPLGQQAQQIAANRVLAWNAEQAQRVAERALAAEKQINWGALEKRASEHAALERFLLANQELTRSAQQYVDAARAIKANSAAAELVAMDARAAKVMMFNPELARAMAQSPEAMRVLMANPEAAKAMLVAPEASRYLLQNPEAARTAMQNAAERVSMERAAAERNAADRAQKGDRAYK